MWKFRPKGLSVSDRTFSIAGLDLVGAHDMPAGQESEAAGIAGGRHQFRGVATQPIAVWMIG